ncbi:MAG: hypothetical protein WCE90_12555 [Candidatus Zixiibacteriota bacterium]
MNPAFRVDKLRVPIYFIFEKLKRKRGIIRTEDGCIDIEVFYWWYQYRLSIQKTSVFRTILKGEEIVCKGDPELTEHSYSSFPRISQGISLGFPIKRFLCWDSTVRVRHSTKVASLFFSAGSRIGGQKDEDQIFNVDTPTVSVYFTLVDGARQLERGVSYECLGESDKGIP